MNNKWIISGAVLISALGGAGADRLMTDEYIPYYPPMNDIDVYCDILDMNTRGNQVLCKHRGNTKVGNYRCDEIRQQKRGIIACVLNTNEQPFTIYIHQL